MKKNSTAKHATYHCYGCGSLHISKAVWYSLNVGGVSECYSSYPIKHANHIYYCPDCNGQMNHVCANIGDDVCLNCGEKIKSPKNQ